ncbi:hypothetical protein LPJ78_001631 [Coemansia sp. RSA 989]|nr:hypothetical protein LPJ78_001631 [Coemansia sp. RSA 989]KAJ2674961.1 hypothetical protein IWW42_001463 [Coemansia sp. RSA 1085]
MFVAGKKRKTPNPHGQTAPSTRPRLSGASSYTTAGSAETAAKAQIDKWYKLGVENTRERQYHVALDYYNRAIAIALNESVRNARLYEARAKVLQKLGDLKRAMSDAKEAIVIDGSSIAGFLCVSSILAVTGKLADALEVINRGLRTIDSQTAGYAQMVIHRESIKQQLDPSYVPAANVQSDPFQYLPDDLAVLILKQLDVRMLAICRGVSRRWMVLIDSAPVIWSNPYIVDSTEDLLSQLPAYTKPRKLFPRQKFHVPEQILRRIFTHSRGSLTRMHFPGGVAATSATIDALLSCRRPCSSCISIDKAAVISDKLINRILNWGLTSHITEIRLPYRSSIGDEAIHVIAGEVPGLRVLDISGCTNIHMKQFFKAWNSVLTEAHEATRLEALYMNDHPGIPELLVYSTKYRHFSNLKLLHIAIRDQHVLSLYNGLGSLMNYLQRIPNPQVPFPRLIDLNIDGVWDTAVASQRFESMHNALLICRCRLLCSGLRRLSAIGSTAVNAISLHESLLTCFPALRQLHLTRAMHLDNNMLVSLMGTHQLLPLVSLDLSGCVALDGQALAMLVSRCTDLVYVNLSQTEANNAVIAEFIRMLNTDQSPGLEVVALDTTDITGAAIRDFASACAKRYCRIRNSANRAWRLRLLDIDNCSGIGSDAVSIVRDLLSFMQTRVLSAVPM